MAGTKLRWRPHVEDHQVAAAQAGGELVAADRLQTIAVTEVGLGESLDPRHVLGRDIAQCRPERLDSSAGQCVVDASAVTTGAQQSCTGHGPEVMRRVRHALADLVGDLVHGTFALGEQVNDLCPPSAGQRLCYFREPVEQRVLGRSVTHAPHRPPSEGACQEFK